VPLRGAACKLTYFVPPLLGLQGGCWDPRLVVFFLATFSAAIPTNQCKGSICFIHKIPVSSTCTINVLTWLGIG
jgi:hypothetical protein